MESNVTDKKVLVTGANGHLGQRLIGKLISRGIPVVALVRSAKARERLLQEFPQLDARELVYDSDSSELDEVLKESAQVVHLAGILKETAGNTYEKAHVGTTKALLTAAGKAEIRQFIYLGILGSQSQSDNGCLASKGKAAEQVMAAGNGLVLNVPMVLGENDYASASLRRQAAAGVTFTFRAGSKEQPVYAGDVVQAIINLLVLGDRIPLPSRQIDLAGPESLERGALIKRAARTLGKNVRVISLPVVLGMGMAVIMERLMSAPPVTRDMLAVLDHDDCIDPLPVAKALGIELTGLNEMLLKIL